MRRHDLSGRIAVVTGAGRRQGIGAAICRALASAGADICFTHWQRYDESMSWGVEEDGPRLLREQLLGLGARSENLAVDLRDPPAAVRLLDEVERRLGPPAILVNNAAHSTRDGYERLARKSVV